jgi:hypothetical protein
LAKKPTLSAAALPTEQKAIFDAALKNWEKVAKEAAELTAKENELRTQIVNMFFANAAEGTNTMKLEDGRELKADIRINRSVDRSQLEGLQAFLDANKMANDPDIIARCELLKGIIDRIVAYKPELVQGEYKDLTPEAKKLMGDIVTEKVGTPGLKVHVPPPKK